MIISGGMIPQAQLEVSLPYCPKVIEPEPSLEVKYFPWDKVPENGKYGNIPVVELQVWGYKI